MRVLRTSVPILVFLLALPVFLWVRLGLATHARTDGQPDEPVQAVDGDLVCRPDGSPWASKSTSAFVLVTSPTCGACQLAKSFDDEVYAYATRNAMPVYYLLPVGKTSDSATSDLKRAGRVVLRTNLGRFGASRLPTFLRLSYEGRVQSKWTGTVPAWRHDEVLTSITVGRSLEHYQTIVPAQLSAASVRSDVQVLTLSRLPEAAGVTSVWIPFSELSVRAAYELDPRRTTLIDCGTTLKASTCQDAAIFLAKERFDVITVGLPSWRSCR
jgi:hypothetical protein